ncbi:gliding motility protein GldB-related protein [Hymenobacter psychrophilus]|uniref:Predicted Zn-dependent protease n=1 Tax=Hymenobacter psychrophilus TaxID=651662 RepID=A0A1H3NA59_9BACT|nr:DUF2268 domain-containing putative Zn-dependent protease [Hymenobacter psychrophilus]SDY85827.1 Predicted Zn-dependent protease [Hymenobacter psychrophilus]
MRQNKLPVIVLMAGLFLTQCTSSRRTAEVAAVDLISTDIDLFWVAYPAAMRDTAQAGRVFAEQYFAKGSPGLRDYFARKYQGDARRFARSISQRPRFYASIRPATLAVASQKPQILAAFRRLQQLYPPVRFNDAYFLMGGFAGSTAQPVGLLMEAEQTSCGPGVDTAELTLVQRNRCGAVADLPAVITHEMVHNVQQPHDGTLLGGVIREGMADFVAELVTGQPGGNARLHLYGNAHEQQLWREFVPEMNGRDPRNWLANSKQETAERPCDLGYYVGYRICQAYYEQVPDKRRALAELLETKDFNDLLARSSYAAKMSSR